MNQEQQNNEVLQPGQIEQAEVPAPEPMALESDAAGSGAIEPDAPVELGMELDMDELFAEMLSAEEAVAAPAGEAIAADLSLSEAPSEAQAPSEAAAPEMPAVEVAPVSEDVPVAAQPEPPMEFAARAAAVEVPAEVAAEVTAEIEADLPEPEFPVLEAADGAGMAVEEPAGIDWLDTGAEVPEPARPPAAAGSEALPFDASSQMLEELLADESSLPVEAPGDLDFEAAPHMEEGFGGFAAPAGAVERQTEQETGRSSPPLEELIGGIDAQLETAVPATAPTEQPATPHKQFSQLDDYVVFSLSGGDYALPVRDVAEIGRVPTVTKVPNVPEFVRGITNLRGEIVPVLNLPQLLGLQETAVTARGRVLFLQARDQVAASGLLVDEVKGIQRIPSQQLEHVTGLVDDKVTSVLRGVHGRGDRLLNVLDLEQVFRLEEFQRFERR